MTARHDASGIMTVQMEKVQGGIKKGLKLLRLSSLGAKHLPDMERNQEDVTTAEQFGLKGTSGGHLVQPQHSEKDQY